MSSLKILKPKSDLIERTALEMAAVFWEAARSSGLAQGKHKNARSFAKANIEKFIPFAVKHLIEILNNPEHGKHIKDEIYEALMDRVNDPDLQLNKTDVLPDVDVRDFIQHYERKEQSKVINLDIPTKKTVLHR